MHPFHGQGEKDMKVEKILRDQSGTVLVIALMMMVIFTLIVISASSTAIIESRLSGNKRMSTAAFYAADSGLHVAAANIDNFMPDEYVNNKYNIFTDPANPNPTNAKVVIEHNATQQGAPRGTGMSAINFEFKHFVIASTGQDSTEPGLSKPTCTVEEKVVRLVPTLQGGY